MPDQGREVGDILADAALLGWMLAFTVAAPIVGKPNPFYLRYWCGRPSAVVPNLRRGLPLSLEPSPDRSRSGSCLG
jgi:hypothetical protein